ncbi:MAG: metallophosphoesterase family protein [Chloroflexota bacterium]
MTRLAVLADIHGNLPALEAVLADMAQFKVDSIIVAGDVVNWGAFSPQVMDRLHEIGAAVIRGNHEIYMLDQGTARAPEAWANFVIPAWTRTQLGTRRLNQIATWPDTLSLRFRDAPTLRIVHGSPRDHFEPIYPDSTDADIATMLASVDETTVICAHTHLPLDRQVGRWHVINPGSVGVPLMGIVQASYIVLDSSEDGWTATYRSLPFDNTPTFEELERSGFIEACGVTALLLIEEYKTARSQIAPFARWHAQKYPTEPQRMEHLAEFSALDLQERLTYSTESYRRYIATMTDIEVK